jgi:hypothetical protein
MILRYRPVRMALTAAFVAIGALGFGWLGLHVPVPDQAGRYSLLYRILGHDGLMVFFLVAAAILIHSAYKLARPIASGYVAAESDDTGVRLLSAGHPISLKWEDIHSIERKEIGARNKVPVVVLHHEPKKAGVFGNRRTSTLIPKFLTADEEVFENWLAQVQARIKRS